MYIGLAIFLGGISLPAIILRWYYFRFQITPVAVNIYSGIFARQQRSIPVGKIQNVEVRQNFMQRLLGLAQVLIETASGGKETEGMLQFVGAADAERIRSVIYRYQHFEHSDSIFAAQPTVQSDERILFSMSLGDVLVSGMMRFSPLFFAVAFSIFQYSQFMPGGNPFEQLAGRLEQMEKHLLILTLFLLVLGAIVFSWVSGIIVNFNRFYGFSLILRGNKLFKQYGLLARWKGTIPLQKIQMIQFVANPIMRFFGFSRLDVQTAGFGDEKSGAEVAIPMARFPRVIELAHAISAFSIPDSFLPLSPIAVRRAAVQYGVMIALPIIVLGYFQPDALWGLFVLPAAYLFSLLRYRWRGYSLDSFGNILVKSGYFINKISVIPIANIQTLVVSRTFMQRYLGLATIIFDTAATAHLRDAAIEDISNNDAEQLAANIERLLHHKK